MTRLHCLTQSLPPRLLLAALALALGLVAGCAKSSDVKRLEEANQVQDQRLKALEDSLGRNLQQQKQLLEELQRKVNALRGQVSLNADQLSRMSRDQTALSDTLERDTAGRSKLTRQVSAQVKKMGRFQVETQSEMDKLRLRLGDLEKLLSSPIAKLPAKTQADKAFRQAFFLLIDGQLDLAADHFAAFRKAYPKDPRAVEALFREGQAYFLLRKYDRALIPFFELVDKHPKDAFAVPTRWMLARALEETGDLKLAREFYAQLINSNSPYAADATRRVAFINKLYPKGGGKPGAPRKQ